MLLLRCEPCVHSAIVFFELVSRPGRFRKRVGPGIPATFWTGPVHYGCRSTAETLAVTAHFVSSAGQGLIGDAKSALNSWFYQALWLSLAKPWENTDRRLRPLD